MDSHGSRAVDCVENAVRYLDLAPGFVHTYEIWGHET